jgi:hypothetical protein
MNKNKVTSKIAHEEKYFIIFSIWGENTKIWELMVYPLLFMIVVWFLPQVFEIFIYEKK